MDSDFVMKKFWFECLLELWEFSLQDKDTGGLGIDHVHQEIERITRESNDARERTTNVQAHMTKWVMLDHKPFKIISDKVEKTIQDYFHEYTDLDLETFMTTCWGSIYKKGDYATLHAHVPALYSWVYYVKVENDAAPLHFPRKVIGDVNDPNFGWKDDNPDSGLYYKPKSGTGIIFPGWFQHQVPEHTGDNERIIVVGNVEGTGSVTYPQKKREFFRINE
tara:strand:- start:1932 stop:2594 length:663 start_codon:yes stop_codon:yes gene_type:complete